MLSIISLSIEIVIVISINQCCYKLLYTEISIAMYFFKIILLSSIYYTFHDVFNDMNGMWRIWSMYEQQFPVSL